MYSSTMNLPGIEGKRHEIALEVQACTEEFSELLAKLADEAVKGIADQLRKTCMTQVSQLLPEMMEQIHSRIIEQTTVK